MIRFNNDESRVEKQVELLGKVSSIKPQEMVDNKTNQPITREIVKFLAKDEEGKDIWVSFYKNDLEVEVMEWYTIKGIFYNVPKVIEGKTYDNYRMKFVKIIKKFAQS